MANGLVTLGRMRARAAWNSLLSLRHHSILKMVVILIFAAGLWAGLFFLFMDAFRFLDNDMVVDFRAILVEVLFAVFFLSLLVMLMFSNGIIAYGSLFRSEEAAFLFARPFSAAQVFVYKLSETLLFSSWAFLFLALPLVVAYGISDGARWYYYPGAAAFFGVFALLPAALGGAVTLLIARFLSRSPRRVLAIAAGCVAVVALAWVLGVAKAYRMAIAQSGEAWLRNVLGHLSLAQSPLLPSYWAARGVQGLARGQLGEAAYRMGLLLSTALFAGMLTTHAARWLYAPAYHRVQSRARRRRGRASGWFYRVLEKAMAPMDPNLRLLVVKDVKTFLRDPVQWSQVLIFFGLLAVYFINMRNLQYDIQAPFWKNLISLLNLVATSLTLSTFTSRFIFPLISLEGRRFWILGLLPIDRTQLLASKFCFALAGSFLVSEGLILISDLMLKVSLPVMGLHAIIVLIICCGLSGLAVGTGALYPNLREDNPSKIVSGFGGTLNLVLSIIFVAVVLGLMAVPYHVGQMGRSVGMRHLQVILLPGSILAVLVGAVATILPLWLGSRAFGRVEV